MRLILPATLCLVSMSCSSPAEIERPSIVLISIDTLRSDWLSLYGDTRVSTPALEALAQDAIVFERAFAEVPLTLPSHNSLLSGELPPRHGVRDNVGFAVDPVRFPLLQGRLKALGYTTMGAVSAQVLGRRTGMAAGFDRYDEPELEQGAGAQVTAERSGAVAIAKARQWLSELDDEPFFLFVHLYEPHMPYRPPEPFRSTYGATYAGEIATADSLVGELLDQLRRSGHYDNSLVVVLSDHGEGLGDHGEDEHGLLLYREALQVPLVVKLPGNERANERVSRNVGLIDMVPTVLTLLGQPVPPTLPGVSLLDREVAPDRALYAETMYPLLHFGWSDLAAVIAKDLYLIDSPRPELYDLANDPQQREDLVSDPDVDRRALAAMRSFLAGIDRTVAQPEVVDEETVASLAALGYLGQPSLPEDRSNLSNPSDLVETIRPLLSGMRLSNQGECDQAIVELKRAVEVDQLAALAWQYLGSCYDQLGRREEALAAYQQGLSATGSSSFLIETAARRLLEQGRSQAALELLEAEAEKYPQSAMLRVLASRALLQLGRLSDAKLAASAAVALDDKLGDAFYQRAVVALAERDGAAAVPDLLEAASLDPRHLGARKALAMLRYSQGDRDEAKRLLEEVLAIDPQDADARADLQTLEAEARPVGGPVGNGPGR